MLRAEPAAMAVQAHLRALPRACHALRSCLRSGHLVRAQPRRPASALFLGVSPSPHLPGLLLRGCDGVRTHATLGAEGGVSDPVDAPPPADFGPHIPVLLEPILEHFRGRHLRVYLDGTLGAGGHAAAIAQEHPEMELLIGLDQDPMAHEEARKKLDALGRPGLKVHLVRSNFRELDTVLAELGGELGAGVDGMLFDLGVSSMQLDIAERGFSFMQDGPLDMRMDPAAPLSAEDVVNTWSERELGRILREYGEERRWRLLARRIVEAREAAAASGGLATTGQLVAAIGPSPAPPRQKKGQRRPKQIHPATRAFQALRIAVNDELGVVEEVLPAAVRGMAPGGRLGVIAFHSLEDRLVKTAFRTAAGQPPRTEQETAQMRYVPTEEAPKHVKILTRRPVTAVDEETASNPRSRSAKLRFVEKL